MLRRTHFYCWVHWKYETKSQQKPLLSTHLGGKKPTEIKAFRRWSMGWQNDLSNTRRNGL